MIAARGLIENCDNPLEPTPNKETLSFCPMLSDPAETTEPFLLGYEKKINQRRHALKSRKTIRGNVIIFAHKDCINFFNIPVYTGQIPLFRDVKGYQRRRGDNTQTVKDYQIVKRSLRQSNRQVRIRAEGRRFLLNFPHFFNIPMIRDSLYLIMRANIEIAKFSVEKSQKIRRIFIGNDDMVQVFLPGGNELAAPRNGDDNPYGTVSIVEAPVRRRQRRRVIAT